MWHHVQWKYLYTSNRSNINATLKYRLLCIILIVYTETCKKYSVTVMFYYIFHIKPHYFKVNSCLILMKFLPAKARTYVVFHDYFKKNFDAQILNIHDLNKLKLFVFKSTIIVLCFWHSKFSYVFNLWTLKILRL